MVETIYLALMLLVPISFSTGDSELDWQLHLQTHEAAIRERRLQSCLLSGDILILERAPYKPIPLRKKLKPSKESIGRELA